MTIQQEPKLAGAVRAEGFLTKVRHRGLPPGPPVGAPTCALAGVAKAKGPLVLKARPPFGRKELPCREPGGINLMQPPSTAS